MFQKNPPLPPREHRTPLSAIEIKSSANTDMHSTWYTGFHSSSIMDSHPTRRKSSRKRPTVQNSILQRASNATEALNNVRDMLKQTDAYNACLSKNIEVNNEYKINAIIIKYCNLNFLQIFIMVNFIMF